MARPAPGTWVQGLQGARRWALMVVAVGLVGLGASLLLPQRIVGSWRFDQTGQHAARAALLIDTRGAPLRSEHAGRGDSWEEGRAAPDFELGVRANAGPKGPLTIRLVRPEGTVAWERSIPQGGRSRSAISRLDGIGVWRLEVVTRSGQAWVRAWGHAEASRWSGTSRGPVLPITWIAAGLLAALAVWLGRIGSRTAALVLLAAGLSLPLTFPAFRALLIYPPGPRALGAAAVVLSSCGALALGWTWPHRDGPPPRRVEPSIAVAGALIVAAALRLHPYDLARSASDLPVVLGLLVVAIGGWQVGRRSATRSPATLRVVSLSMLAAVLAVAGVALLIFGSVMAIAAGTGIGLSDNGPDPGLAIGAIVTLLLVCSTIEMAAARCFRAADPRGRRHEPSIEEPALKR
jgi:hypothetical protein